MPPKVQTVAQAMADLDPAYASSRNVINGQITNLGATAAATKSALTAAKGQGFNDINNQATGRGLSFSGIPLDEQATYLSTKYLPGIQQADAQQANDTLTLQGRLADIDKEVATGAVGRVDKQTSDLNSWNQAEIDRNFRATEAEKDRTFQASESARARAAAAAEKQTADRPPTVSEYLQEAFGSNYNGDNAKNGWTENVLAGNLASAYGLSRNDALSMAYAYRKKYYGK